MIELNEVFLLAMMGKMGFDDVFIKWVKGNF